MNSWSHYTSLPDFIIKSKENQKEIDVLKPCFLLYALYSVASYE